MIQIVSLVGSLLILAAYVAGQRGLMRPEQRTYVVLNFVGSVVLTFVAIAEEQWGFLLLEGVWALVSGYTLLRPPRPPDTVPA